VIRFAASHYIMQVSDQHDSVDSRFVFRAHLLCGEVQASHGSSLAVQVAILGKALAKWLTPPSIVFPS